MSQAIPVKDGRCDRRRDSRKIDGKVVEKSVQDHWDGEESLQITYERSLVQP